VSGMEFASTITHRTFRDSIVSLLVALCTGAAGATTTTVITTTTTTTTLPPTPPSALCTCQSGLCEVVAGSYTVNPGSVLDFRPCALTIDSGGYHPAHDRRFRGLHRSPEPDHEPERGDSRGASNPGSQRRWLHLHHRQR